MKRSSMSQFQKGLRAKDPQVKIPTGWQARTLEWLMEGHLLIIGKWPDMSHHPDPGVQKYSNKERIYWKIKVPQLVSPLNPEGWDTVDCGYPKMKRYWMSHMERYGWVKYTGTTWEITEDGKKAKERYDAWYKAACESLGSPTHGV